MKILVALGGNAIRQRGSGGTSEEQLERVAMTCKELVAIIRAGHQVAITHGNGPQVGDILLANEMARSALPPMPLDVCGAESQGLIGYMFQQCLENELRAAGIDKGVATVVTQTVVDASDPAFEKPSKPIGPYYTEDEAAALRREKRWTLVNDSDRGYRRAVPSPDPEWIVEASTILRLFEEGTIVIAAGGGGVPVVRDPATGRNRGIEAVIDKDLGAALLAKLLGVDMLMILTEVEGVMLNYGRRDQMMLRTMTAKEGRKYLDDGQFPPGSMGPKVDAALRFVESGGKKAVITSVESAEAALVGTTGTMVTAV
jgi:carbamate kinase